MSLVWTRAAQQDMEEVAAWSSPQALAVVAAMERMAEVGWSLGKPTGRAGVRYWPVPPLGVFYRVLGDQLIIVQVADVRRLLESP